MAWIHVDRRSGETLEHQGFRLTPEHLVFQVDLPFVQGGLVFNRPIGVKVETPDGQITTQPIFNMTRVALVAIMGLGLLGVMLERIRRKS